MFDTVDLEPFFGCFSFESALRAPAPPAPAAPAPAAPAPAAPAPVSVFPDARLCPATDETRTTAATESSAKMTFAQVEGATLAEVMDPKHPVCRWFVAAQETAAARARHSWTHHLLYRPRTYVTPELAQLGEAAGPAVRTYVFYRRVLQGFVDNWATPRPLAYTVEAPRARSLTPARRTAPARRAATLQPALPAAPAGERFCAVAFLIPPFFLFATRVLPAALRDFEPDLHRLVGQATQQFLRPRPAAAWLRDVAADLDPQPVAVPSFFGLPRHGWPRIVMRCQSATLLADLKAALLQAAQRGEALAITAGEFDPARQSSGKRPACVPKLPTLGPQITLTHNQAQSLIMLIGGKDMLALDWLPFVSRFLHHAVSKRSIEHLEQHATHIDKGTIRCVYHGSFLLYEYPGYGFCTGTQTPAACVASACQALKAVVRKQKITQPIDLVILGYSLGCGIALQTCTKVLSAARKTGSRRSMQMFRLKQVILLAPPTTISECAAHVLRIPSVVQPLAVKLMNRVQSTSISWDNIEATKQLFAVIAQLVPPLEPPRVAVFHGGQDTMVAPAMGSLISRTAKDTLAEAIHAEEQYHNPDRVRIAGLRRAMAGVTVEIFPDANHLSVAGHPKYQHRIHDLCYNAAAISIIGTAPTTDEKD